MARWNSKKSINIKKRNVRQPTLLIQRLPARRWRRVTSALVPGQWWRQKWDWMRETPRASCTPTVSSWCFERWPAVTSRLLSSVLNLKTWKEKTSFLAHVSASSWYTEGNVVFLGSGSLFLLFSSIIIDCVSLPEVCWHNQDKWRSSTTGVV